MKDGFRYDISNTLWSLFEDTGKIGYYMLFKAVECERDLIEERDTGR